jgi:hypothetical protein
MRISSSFGAVAATAITLLAGCAAEGDRDAAADLSQDLVAGTPVPNPSGGYAAKITLSGTACPNTPDSYDATISPDGENVQVRLNSWGPAGIMLNAGTYVAIKDCNIVLDLSTTEARSFAVTSFEDRHAASLDSAGMKATLTASYGFPGASTRPQLRVDAAGPYDDSIAISQDVAEADRVWSPCGKGTRLTIQSRAIAMNNAQRSGNAYIDLVEDDTAFPIRYGVGLASKPCAP